MATAIFVCRVCGKEYPGCRSQRRGDTTFRWQDVACSPECGAEYLRRIMISRGLLVEEEKKEEKPVEKKTRRKKAAEPVEEKAAEA